MKKLIVLFSMITSVLILTECKKYPDGPSISFRSAKERVSNTWKIEKLIKNNVDSTSYYTNLLKDYTATLSKSGSYTISYYVVVPILGNLSNTESGSWTLSSDKKTLNINPTSIVVGSVPAASSWQILKLYEKSLWIRDIDSNGNTTEFHFIPK